MFLYLLKQKFMRTSLENIRSTNEYQTFSLAFECRPCHILFLFPILLFFRRDPRRIFFEDYPGPWYRRFADRQPSTLATRVDRLLAALYYLSDGVSPSPTGKIPKPCCSSSSSNLATAATGSAMFLRTPLMTVLPSTTMVERWCFVLGRIVLNFEVCMSTSHISDHEGRLCS